MHYINGYIKSQVVFIFYKFSKNYGTKGGYIHPVEFEKIYNSNEKRKIILVVSFLVRIILPIFLFIYLNPINAMIINQILVDNIDPIYLVNVNSNLYNRVAYQNWDKIFDLWGYFISLYPVLFVTKLSIPTQIIFILLFIYRVIGVIIWYLKQKEDIFIYFPDFYTALYYIIYGCILFKIKNKYIIFVFIILSFYLKLLHERDNHSQG